MKAKRTQYNSNSAHDLIIKDGKRLNKKEIFDYMNKESQERHDEWEKTKLDGASNGGYWVAPVEPLILPNLQYNKYWAISGLVLNVLSLGILIPLVRGPFFERPNYYNRKALYKWMQCNRLPAYKSIVSRKVWELTPTIKIFLYNDGKWNLNQNGELKISSFNIFGFDRYRYKKILSLLKHPNTRIWNAN